MLIHKVMQHIRAPEKPLETHVRVGATILRSVLRRLEWTVIRRLDGLLHGDYRTLFRGFGLDLADLREYQYHDDVRHIDWNVTARIQTPVRARVTTRTARSPAWFLLDLSPSVDFGSESVQKRAVSSEFVTVLARLLTRHGNRVGALFYGGDVDTVIPARSGRRHVLHILHRMLTRPELLAVAAAPTSTICCATGFDVDRRGARSCSSCPISSARPAGRSRSPTSRSAMKSSRCGSTIRWRWSCPTWGCSSSRTRRPASRCSSTRTTAASASASPAAAERREEELRAAFRRRRRGRARAVHRRRPRRRDPAVRRSAQAAQPARGGRRHAAAHARAWRARLARSTSSGPTALAAGGCVPRWSLVLPAPAPAPQEEGRAFAMRA